jgi:DNA invertase Pin-like site-specific DNA recombinase
VRHEFEVVTAWSVNRLGRSLQDLVSFLGEVHGAGVGLYLDRQGVDDSTPAGKALFQMLGVFAEFERSIMQETHSCRHRPSAPEAHEERQAVRPASGR